MNKYKLSRLGGYILFCILFALILSAALYFALTLLSDDLIGRHFSKSSVAENNTKKEVENFQNYVSDNGLTTKDIKPIQSWVNSEKYVLMNIYKDNILVYSSSAPFFTSEMFEMNNNKFKIQQMAPPWRQLYNITFSDGATKVDIIWLAASSYYDIAEFTNLAVSFLCFVIIFLILLNRKISYINRLANELKIIEGGDLDYAVTIKGKDELSFLANGIDKMRKSFSDRMKSEEEAKNANSELITSISHDLRTPLTILIGFLDIISCKKYKTEEQLSHYIESSREKAYQIKELSDKLFEYFLVYGSTNREPELELYDSNILLTQLIGEHMLSLEDQGFTVKITSEIPHCKFKANHISIQRIFDNLFGNVSKYADTGAPVSIAVAKTGSWLSVAISNNVKTNCSSTESTGIGLKTCQKIMLQHNGSMKVFNREGIFEVTVDFPINTKLKVM